MARFAGRNGQIVAVYAYNSKIDAAIATRAEPPLTRDELIRLVTDPAWFE